MHTHQSTRGRLDYLKTILKARHGQKGHVENCADIRKEIKRLEGVFTKRAAALRKAKKPPTVVR